jgi:hypothetical protein
MVVVLQVDDSFTIFFTLRAQSKWPMGGFVQCIYMRAALKRTSRFQTFAPYS